MDTRLEKALEFAKYNHTLQTQRDLLRFKFTNKMTYFYNGGTFKVSMELVSFIKTLQDMGATEAVIIDIRGNPIRINDLESFIVEVLSVYSEATNEYVDAYDRLSKCRSVSDILELNDE